MGSSVRTVFGTTSVFVVIALAAVADSSAAASAATGSKRALSIGSGTLAVRHLFFGIWTTLIAALFWRGTLECLRQSFLPLHIFQTGHSRYLFRLILRLGKVAL